MLKRSEWLAPSGKLNESTFPVFDLFRWFNIPPIIFAASQTIFRLNSSRFLDTGTDVIALDIEKEIE